MARRSLLLLVPVCLLLAGRPAEANCEAGGYFIHTTAKYLEESSRIWFFRYEILGQELRLASVATLGEQVLPELLTASKRMSIEHNGGLCTAGGRGGAARIIRVEEEGFPAEDKLALPHCFSSRSLPRNGYASYDRDSRLLRLASALPVDRSPVQVPDRSEIEEGIRGNLFKLGLTVQENGETRIMPDDVEQTHFAYTLVGNREQPFAMAVAILRLRNLVRLFSGDLSDEYWKTFSASLADFPVIFFRRPGGAPFYVGDGSWCSSYRLRMPAAPDVRVLDPLERFELTGAYDLERDGLPDLLVVNERFVYFLAPDGSLQVVHYGQGC